MWWQVVWYPWISWWVITSWEEAVEEEDEIKQKAVPYHSREPIYDETRPVVAPEPVEPSRPTEDGRQDPFRDNTEDGGEPEGEDPYDPRREPNEEGQSPPHDDWDEDYWDWDMHDNDYDDWSDW